MVKVEGKENDLVDRIANDPVFGVTKEEILEALKPNLYVGCATLQVTDFLENVVNPILSEEDTVETAEITV